MAEAALKVSFTETRNYRRLVQFVAEVEEHAETSDDPGLEELVRRLHVDLLAISTS